MGYALDALPVGTKVQIKNTFERNGETGLTAAPDFEAVITELGHIEKSRTGLQSYVVELTGLVPDGMMRKWWADETQFDVMEDN